MIATKCPLCEADLNSLYNSEDHKQSGFHYRCSSGHGFRIAHLQQIVRMSLEGKSDEEIRNRIKEVKE